MFAWPGHRESKVCGDCSVLVCRDWRRVQGVYRVERSLDLCLHTRLVACNILYYSPICTKRARYGTSPKRKKNKIKKKPKLCAGPRRRAHLRSNLDLTYTLRLRAHLRPFATHRGLTAPPSALRVGAVHLLSHSTRAAPPPAPSRLPCRRRVPSAQRARPAPLHTSAASRWPKNCW